MVESMAPNSFSWSDKGVSSHEHEEGTPQSCRGALVCVYKIMQDTKLYLVLMLSLPHQMPSEKLVFPPAVITYIHIIMWNYIFNTGPQDKIQHDKLLRHTCCRPTKTDTLSADQPI